MQVGNCCRRALLLLVILVAACAAPAAAPTQPAAPPAGVSAGSAASAPAPTAPAAAAPAAAAPAGPTTINLAITSPIAIYLPIYIAQEEGFFAREGLDVDLVYTQSGVRSTQQLVGGSVDMAIPGPDAALVANSKGADLRIIAGWLHSVPYSFMVQPEIRSVADLRGQTVGASGLKGGSAIVMRRMLEKAGLEKDRDYSIAITGATPEALAALRAKAVQAVLVFQPQDYQLMEEGFVRLADAREVLPSYAFISVVSRADWLAGHRAEAVRFLRATIAAERWFYDPANRARAIQIMVDVTKVEPRYAERTYDFYFQDGNIIAHAGEIDDASLQAVIDVLLLDGDLDAAPSRETYRDDSLLAEALR
jgi:NitT/TauT family transport system substrate-binding protein